MHQAEGNYRQPQMQVPRPPGFSYPTPADENNNETTPQPSNYMQQGAFKNNPYGIPQPPTQTGQGLQPRHVNHTNYPSRSNQSTPVRQPMTAQNVYYSTRDQRVFSSSGQTPVRGPMLQNRSIDGERQVPQMPPLGAPRPPIDPNAVIKTLFAAKGISLDHSRKLGSGRYSKVITAQAFNGFELAIKMINKLKVTKDFLKRFLPRELANWKMLVHPNIIRLFRHYEALDHVFLVMEFGSGGDMLSHVQKNGAVPEPQAAFWLYQVCSAIVYMHSVDVAHRDLKLENIVIFGQDVKVADLGFSRKVEGEFSETFCGSKAYSAPEILLGNPYNPFKADVWSIGVVGFVMTTDTMPFREDLDNQKIVKNQKERRYRFPTSLPLSEECKDTINTLMTFDPLNRYTSFEAIMMPWINAGKGYGKPLLPSRSQPPTNNNTPSGNAFNRPTINDRQAHPTYYAGVREQ